MNSKAQAGTSTLETLIIIVLAAFLILGFLKFIYGINIFDLAPTPKATLQNFDSITQAFRVQDGVLRIPVKESDTYAVFDQDHAFIQITKNDSKKQYLAKPSACGVLMACVMYCADLTNIDDKGEEFFCVSPSVQRFNLGKGLKTSSQQGGIIIFSNELDIDNNGIRLKEEGYQLVGYSDVEIIEIEGDTVKAMGESFLRVFANRFDLKKTITPEEFQSILDVVFNQEEIKTVEIFKEEGVSGGVGVEGIAIRSICLKLYDKENKQIFPRKWGLGFFTDDCFMSQVIDDIDLNSASCVGNPMRFTKGNNPAIFFEYVESPQKKYTAKCVSP